MKKDTVIEIPEDVAEALELLDETCKQTINIICDAAPNKPVLWYVIASRLYNSLKVAMTLDMGIEEKDLARLDEMVMKIIDTELQDPNVLLIPWKDDGLVQ